MRRFPIFIAMVALVTSACAGPGVLVAGDAALNPEPPGSLITVTVVAGDDRTPVPNAEVVIGRSTATADDVGTFEVMWQDAPIQLSATAPGFAGGSATVEEYPEETEGDYYLVIDPLILEGRVVGSDGRPLPYTTVSLNGRDAVTDDQGRFELTRALPGEVTAQRPAWEPTMAAWDGETQSVELELEPREIYGLRVSGDKAADPEVWANLLDIADQSNINSFTLDTKDENGWVFYNSQVPLVAESGALNEGHLYDVEQVLADMDAHGLYKVTRITTFQDNFVAQVRPDWAIKNENTGEPWQNDKGLRWLDPTNRDSWEYALALAEEACELGFDEIQFDYIRFPSDGDISTVSTQGDYGEENRIATINAFLEAAHELLNPMGCAVAADIFAITLTSDWDEGIGQRPEEVSKRIDVVSPMVYTYTYGRGWGGYDDPNDHPVELVSMALDAGIPKNGDGFAIMRPWIQTWQLDASQINSVQRAVEERGLGWMIWSANTIYDMSFMPTGG